MKEVAIQIPELEAEQNIEITIKINGKKRMMNYKVEIVEWEEDDVDKINRVQTIRRVLTENERDWELINVGTPTNDGIPIMFRKKKVEHENVN